MSSKLESNTQGMQVSVSKDVLDNYLNRGIDGDREQILKAVRTFKNLTHYSLQTGIYGTELANKIIEEILKNKNPLRI